MFVKDERDLRKCSRSVVPVQIIEAVLVFCDVSLSVIKISKKIALLVTASIAQGEG